MSTDFKTINVPQSDVNDLMSTLVEWHVANDSYVSVGDTICTMETSKMVFDVESEYEGYVYLLREEGEEVGTLEPLVLIADSLNELNDQKDSFIANINKENLGKGGQSKNYNATKKAIIRAEESGVDLDDLDVDGVIKEKDVDEFLKANRGKVNNSPSSDKGDEIYEKKIKIIGNKKAGRDLMLESSRNIPPSYVEKEIDVTCLVAYVKKTINEGKGYITPLSIIMYALGQALLKHKGFNSFRENDFVVNYSHVNIGIVVNIDNNLSVPILRDVNELDPPSILKRLFELRKDLMAGKTNADDFVGGTFTVSAMDHTSVDRFIPIIHPGQAAVLAVPRIFEKLKLDSEGALARANYINLGLSFDHTFLNAMQGIEFLDTIESEVCSYIEKS